MKLQKHLEGNRR